MIATPLTVWAIDPAGKRRGQAIPLSAQAVLRDCDVGTWAMTFAQDDPTARLFNAGWGIYGTDGLTAFSGPATKVGQEIDGTPSIVMSGITDLHRLADRIVYPNPTKTISTQDEARYERSGPAERVIQDMVHANVGASALLPRRSPRFASLSEGRGATVSVSARLTSVLEVARGLARLGGLTFDVVMESDGIARMRFRVPRDLSRAVRLTADNGGATSGTYTRAAPTCTAAIVAAQGEGAERNIYEQTSTDSWGRRIEVLKDRRDTSDTSVTDQAGTEALAAGAPSATAAFEAQEVEGAVFGRDYLLGDTITIDPGGLLITEPVRAVDITWDGHGRSVRLTVGDHEQADDSAPAWYSRVTDLDARLRSLEAR